MDGEFRAAFDKLARPITKWPGLLVDYQPDPNKAELLCGVVEGEVP